MYEYCEDTRKLHTVFLTVLLLLAAVHCQHNPSQFREMIRFLIGEETLI